MAQRFHTLADISYGSETMKLKIPSSSSQDTISAAIRARFGLSDTTKFTLTDADGCVVVVDGNLDTGSYTLSTAGKKEVKEAKGLGKRRVAQYHKYSDDYKGLEVTERIIREPGEGEIVVHVKAAGVNPVDWKIYKGFVKALWPNIKFPIVPGWDVSGVVVARGHAARRFEVGDEVFGYIRQPMPTEGGYTTHVTTPEAYFAKKAKSQSHIEAAGVPLAGLTAYQAISKALGEQGVAKATWTPGQTVVVLGASGGVGSFGVQLLAHGAKAKAIIGVASSKNHEYLRSIGATHVVDYRKGDIGEQIKKLFPEGVDCVLDFYGGTSAEQIGKAIKKGGSVASICTGANPATDRDDIKYEWFLVEPHSKQLATLAALAEAGKFKVEVAKVFPLGDAAKALQESQKLATRGKLVLDTTK